MNLPNALAISRLVAIPVLMVLLVASFPGHDQWAAALFLMASLTDTVDGQLARRRSQVTELGKFLDPLADKLFILSVLIVLVQEGLLAAWVVILIFGREMLITILRSLSASQGRVIAATPFGKTKTVTQVGAVLLLILSSPYPQLHLVATAGIYLAVVFTIWSGVDYLVRFRYVFMRAPSTAPMAALMTAGGSGGGGEVDPLAVEIGEALRAAGLTLATAESCTGGLVAKLITDRPGSSAWFRGGVVAYADEVKRDQLGVPAELLAAHGAVSAEVAQSMAIGIRTRLDTSLGVAVTGIAGPDGGRPDKPVGLTFVAVAGENLTEVRRFLFDGDRWSNRRQAAEECLRMVLTAIEQPAETAR
jgi:CDP-diacylglycerol--glycerol-3-phosphate 3-phosphatidyltransferase